MTEDRATRDGPRDRRRHPSASDSDTPGIARCPPRSRRSWSSSTPTRSRASSTRVVAVDAGVDHLFRHGGVTPEAVRDLVYGALFTRGPADLHRTAIFVGGSDVAAGEAVLEAVKATFFGPLPGLGPVRRQRRQHHGRRRRAGGARRGRAGRSRACRPAVLGGDRAGRPAGRPAPGPARRRRSPSARASLDRARADGRAPPRRPPAARSRRSPPPTPDDLGRGPRRGRGRRRRGRRGRDAPARVGPPGAARPEGRHRPQRRPPAGHRGGRGRPTRAPTATASAPGGRSGSAAPR